jgi:hypothetical protein
MSRVTGIRPDFLFCNRIGKLTVAIRINEVVFVPAWNWMGTNSRAH